MAEYHVKMEQDGTILAGTMTKTGKWNNKSNVTEEALSAVRDHLLYYSAKENKNICYAWSYENGKVLALKIEEVDADKFKEGEET